MSIESMIENLNNTLKELVTTISRQNELISNQSLIQIAQPTKSFTPVDPQATDTAVEVAAKPAPKKTATKPKAEAAAAPEHTFADVQTTVIELVRKINRNAALELLGEYNATNVSGLDPAAYGDVMAKAKALLATVKDPLAE